MLPFTAKQIVHKGIGLLLCSVQRDMKGLDVLLLLSLGSKAVFARLSDRILPTDWKTVVPDHIYRVGIL